MPALATRPAALLLSVALSVFACQTSRAAERPESADRHETFAGFDSVLRMFATSNGIGAVSAAASKFGEPLHTYALGYADARRSLPLTPGARFRIASITKPITAAVLLELVAQGRVGTNTPVLEVLGSPAWPNPADPRWRDITIQQLLTHQGGWDREAAGDPMFQDREAARTLGRPPAGPDDMLRWMLGRPLQFDPGSKSVYANFGYCVLGRIIETTTRQSYMRAVETQIAKPLGITSWSLARNAKAPPQSGEVWYDFARENEHFRIELMDAHGGIISTAADLCRFMDHYWLDGRKRPPRRKGRFVFFGSLPGTTALAVQRPDGINYAVLLNKRGEGEEWHAMLQERLEATFGVPP